MDTDGNGSQGKPVGRAHTGKVDRLRVRHLRLLQLVADQGSLTAAAQALQVSQPAATKMLQELESAFGCGLIERSAKGGALTAAGGHALSRLRMALGALDAATAGLEAIPEQPLVRLGLLPLVAVNALPAAVKAMGADGTLPRMKIREGTVDGLLTLLARGELDCVLGRVEADRANDVALHLARFRLTALWEESLGIAAAPGHPLVAGYPADLGALHAQRWALPPHGSATRQQFDQRFMDAGMLPPPPYIESISFHTNLGLAATGAVMTVAPGSALRRYQERGLVQEVRLANPFAPASVVAVTPDGERLADGVARIIRALRAESPGDSAGE